MLFERIAVLTPEGVLSDRYVATQGATIAHISDAPPAGDWGERYDGRGKLLLPGFVNGHSHTPMTLLRGYGENMVLQDWLQKRIFPFEAQMTGSDIYWATLLGVAEMVRYGITSTTDMYCKLPDMARAFVEGGAKINLSNGITNFTRTPYDQIPAVREARDAVRDWHGAGDGRVLIDLSLHAEYTSDEATARALAEDAARLGLHIHVHVSETRAEHEACKVKFGRTPARYLADCGLFDVPATAAHCVWAEPEDFALLAEKGVTVGTCPKSNLKLASGVFNARAAMAQGVPFAIGTDSVASNNNLNMIEELRTFALVQKGFSADPTLITPAEALYAATRAGALAQGRDDCGEIREGFCADLCVLSLADPIAQPTYDPLTSVVYTLSGSDVVLTMCDGRVLYRDGAFPTLDMERVVRETDAARRRILGAL
ncbi:5-methylthioadenosine/S-adenosylhomocysteine deaminase [Clostridia bacterium]|nr:5-methylthioadenosine/S-adenosylhomocysteine deaminase [Clostridia bacterium]